jgi:hypothetical protein
VNDGLRRRRWVVGGITALVPAALAVGFGHAGVHMARSILVPGAGLYDERPLLGVVLTVAAVIATVAWLRWGVDWALLAVIVGSVALSGLLADAPHGSEETVAAAHEFPLVILVLAGIGWVRGVLRRLPLPRIRLRPERTQLPPVDRCRAAAIDALAGPGGSVDVAGIEAPDVIERARRIALVARGRRGGDPLRGEHAHARAALALCGRLDDAQVATFRSDAARSWAGVPASEPGWVRLLDGTLAALALGDADRWVAMLHGPMRLHRGHRPAWTWTPLGIAAGRADEWEHAAATVLARRAGWIGDDDWDALRKPALGAAARGTAHPADERLIAAGRAWARIAGDDVAARLLARPTVRHDRLAVALDSLTTEGIAA